MTNPHCVSPVGIRMIPYRENKEPRIPRVWEGKVTILDDFDDELPPEILAGFTRELD